MGPPARTGLDETRRDETWEQKKRAFTYSSPPSPVPVSSHLSKHHRIVQLVASSARARSPRPARFTPHTAAVHSPTDSLSPRSPPHRTSLCHQCTTVRRVQVDTIASLPSQRRPALAIHSSLFCSPISDTPAAACPSLVSFLAACFASHIPLPSRATWLSYPLHFTSPSLHIKHSSLRRVLCSGLLFPPIATAHLTAPLRCSIAAARPASARERVLPSLSLRCHHVRHVRRPSAPLHAATTAASCRS